MKRVQRKPRRTKPHSHPSKPNNQTIHKEEPIREDDLFYEQEASNLVEESFEQQETDNPQAKQEPERVQEEGLKTENQSEAKIDVESEEEKTTPKKKTQIKKTKKKKWNAKKREPRSFQEWMMDARYMVYEWSHSPLFTTFAGRFALISLLACSCFALLLTVTLAGCHQNFELTNQTFVMELGTDVYANPSLYINNPETINVSKLTVEPKSPGITILENRFVSVSLDYLGVGTYDFVMKEGRSETPFVIKVKDTQPPTLKASPSQITVDWGKQPDWDEIYGGTDLSGVYYEPNINIWTEAGTHDIEVKIRDRFGNSLIRTLKVTVNS